MRTRRYVMLTIEVSIRVNPFLRALFGQLFDRGLYKGAGDGGQLAAFFALSGMPHKGASATKLPFYVALA